MTRQRQYHSYCQPIPNRVSISFERTEQPLPCYNTLSFFLVIEAVYSLFKVFGWEVQHPGMEDLWRQRVSHSLSFAIKRHICEKAKHMRTKPNAPFGSQKAGSWARALKCQSLRLKFATHWSQRSNYSTGNVQTVANFPNLNEWIYVHFQQIRCLHLAARTLWNSKLTVIDQSARWEICRSIFPKANNFSLIFPKALIPTSQ